MNVAYEMDKLMVENNMKDEKKVRQLPTIIAIRMLILLVMTKVCHVRKVLIQQKFIINC